MTDLQHANIQHIQHCWPWFLILFWMQLNTFKLTSSNKHSFSLMYCIIIFDPKTFLNKTLCWLTSIFNGPSTLRSEPALLRVILWISHQVCLMSLPQLELVQLFFSFKLGLSLMFSLVSIVLSVVAVIIYSVDLNRNPEVPCTKTMYGSCSDQHYVTVSISFISSFHFHGTSRSL